MIALFVIYSFEACAFFKALACFLFLYNNTPSLSFTLNPRYAIAIVNNGINQLNTAHGPYCATLTPRFVWMYAPHVFQGTKALVTVPALSNALDKELGDNSLFLNSSVCIY